MDKELKDKIEELGWFITHIHDGWQLSKYSPLGEDFCIIVFNDRFLDDLSDQIEDFDTNEHVEELIRARDNGVRGIPKSIKALTIDAEEIKEMMIELYNGIKDLKVFNDTREKSQAEDN